MADKPRTAAEILALPIGPAFGQMTRIVNGKQFVVPVAPAVACVFHEPDDVMMVTDAEGTWMLSRYADGRWFRRRL